MYDKYNALISLSVAIYTDFMERKIIAELSAATFSLLPMNKLKMSASEIVKYDRTLIEMADAMVSIGSSEVEYTRSQSEKYTTSTSSVPQSVLVAITTSQLVANSRRKRDNSDISDPEEEDEIRQACMENL
jgi:hypothetical protein